MFMLQNKSGNKNADQNIPLFYHRILNDVNNLYEQMFRA